MQPPPAGNYSYVPLMNAVIVAKGMLEMADSSEYDIRMLDFAQKCVLSMNPISLIRLENITIDVINGVAALPEGVIMSLAMRYCDHEGRSVGPYISDVYWLEQNNCCIDDNIGTNWDIGRVTLVGNEYRWVNPAQAPEKIKAAVLKRAISNDGTFTAMIRDYMELAVAYFVCWQMSMILVRSGKSDWNYVQQYKNNYIGERNSVISGDAQRLMYERRHSFAIMQTPQRVQIP